MESNEADNIIATIENQRDPTQIITIYYVSDENAFVTSGIQTLFAEREIFIPAPMVISDLQLVGAIVSSILEKLSDARDRESTFSYSRRFNVLGVVYTLEPYREYMRLGTPSDES